ncbi:TonB-dependent receptor [Sphingomonas sp. SUN019]|uniref:TonB-dependent receptor domain-containing protein n=1 Tax=Sphingomonas sp. SUN019 TaxID=2937788 RepID=UPI0021649CAE|nr:TonB-dependent receptor [Sphingomonas sp. SUN019]UVO49684.1 TonB-dependent receptor [Sphingomonas sp. SUN019]
MRRPDAFLALTVCCVVPAPCCAADGVQFQIAGGRLDAALISLAEQARIGIDASDPGLAAIRSLPVRGAMPVRAALERLLARSGYTYVFVTSGTVRIVRARALRARARPPPRHQALPPPVQDDIIVTGSKQGTALDRFGGAVKVLELTSADAGRFGMRGSEVILDRLPILASTGLGPGRNKLFIRGVADSSFNGPSQSIIGQYLGDVRLTFDAPDPDLQLVDIARVELLEGPQGTLYGTGSLGGILRLVPTPPDTAKISVATTAGVSSTAHGGWGWDTSGMVNLPIVRDRLALRAVGYASRDAGYIDDLRRRLSNINSTTIRGGRATVLLEAGESWQIEIGGVFQDIAVRDGRYAVRGGPPLTRRSRLAQPFDNDYRLLHATVRKQWDSMELVAATSLVNHALETRFDASGFRGARGPQIYVEDAHIKMLSQEIRLSQPDFRGEGWVIGSSFVHDINRVARDLGRPAEPKRLSTVRNQTDEIALFGQYGQPLTQRLLATIGGRLTYSRLRGSFSGAVVNQTIEADRRDARALPTLALTWRSTEKLLLYARYQEGFRAGGLGTTAFGAKPAGRRLVSDSVNAVEAGFRWGRRGADRIALEAAVSHTTWNDIQADLVDRFGLPFTTNLGDGRIDGVEVEGWWRATPLLDFDLAVFVNKSALSSPVQEFAAADERTLPNIPDNGARAAVHFRSELSRTLAFSMTAAIRYSGESQLGVGSPVEGQQGDIAEAALGARLAFRDFGVTLDVSNIANARGNRFSFGNPFTLAEGRQVTPLRPRTVRMGLSANF